MKKILSLLITVVIAVLLTSCSSDDNINNNTDGMAASILTLSFENIMNTTEEEKVPILLDSEKYITSGSDTLMFSKLKYFISNIKLINSENDTVALEDSYHLISSTKNSGITNLDLEVPDGIYNYISFGLGVDSQANVDETIVSGDLSPSSEMVWNWNVGYKFINIEGTYTGDSNGSLVYHLGTNEHYNTFIEKLPRQIILNESINAMAHIMVDFNQLFDGPNTIDVDAINSVKAMPLSDLNLLMENTKNNLFMIHHIENKVKNLEENFNNEEHQIESMNHSNHM